MTVTRSDVLVLFGATGDLARKKIFPALYELVSARQLAEPIVCIAFDDWTIEQLHARVRQSIVEAGMFSEAVLERLLSQLSYVSGDFNDPPTFDKLRQALGDATRPLYFLAIPPSLFEPVVLGLQKSGGAAGGRLMIEKPFGRNLESAQRLNDTLHLAFAEDAIFRIDHYLGKEAIQNLLYFRFANSFLEPIWNRNHIESVQITMAEAISVSGRGRFYDEVGCIRDVIQNHLLNILLLLAMEPPSGRSGNDLIDEKVQVLKAIRVLEAKDVVRGQVETYQAEPGVRPNSPVETFAAVRFMIDTWRWQGVPFYIRAGKSLPLTATEVVVRLRPPPVTVFDVIEPDEGNYIRFRIGPEVAVAIGARRKAAGEFMIGEQVELLAVDDVGDYLTPYERLIGDAMDDDNQLFTRQDASEIAWRIVEPILDDPVQPKLYPPGSWGPEGLLDDFGPPNGWVNPKA